MRLGNVPGSNRGIVLIPGQAIRDKGQEGCNQEKKKAAMLPDRQLRRLPEC